MLVSSDMNVDRLSNGRIWREWKMKIHKLKLNAKYYEDSERGIKTFEVRKNDRVYKIGDVLELREYIEDIRGLGYYTGNVHWKIITYILDDDLYLAPGYVCLGLSPIAEPEQEDDMSDDLISRKAVLHILYDIKDDDNVPKNYGTVLDIIRKIRKLPTAFDKERVIDELIAGRFVYAGEDVIGESTSIGIDKAIKIVEKGGIE